MGAIGRARGVDMTKLDPECPEQVAKTFSIATAMTKEIVYENDEGGPYMGESDEQRFRRMRAWIVKQIHLEKTNGRSERDTGESQA